MIRFMLACCVALSVAPAAISQTATQPPPPARPDGAEYWTQSADRMTFTALGISFPRRVGAVSFNRSIAFGRNNSGLDNGLIYASDDQALIASVYIYLPGLADAGFSSAVTAHAMRLQSGPGLRALGSRIADAGGRPGVAIRADFAGFRNDNEASSSAFLRVGNWIVKLRVSGPEARRADVERTIAALLAQLRFRDGHAPGAAEMLTVDGDCAAAPASPLASLRALNAADAMDDAIMATAVSLHSEDSGGRSRAPARHWCLSSLRQAGQYRMPVLRIPPSPTTEDSRRSVALAMLNDSDGVIEVVERRFRDRSRFMLLWHSTGRTQVLGGYDGSPSDAQIGAVIAGSDAGGIQARATIDYQANGDSQVTVHVAPDAGAGSTPPPQPRPDN